MVKINVLYVCEVCRAMELANIANQKAKRATVMKQIGKVPKIVGIKWEAKPLK